MKLLVCFLVLLVAPASAFAKGKRETYDLVQYTAPPPLNKIAWKKATHDKNSISFTITDLKTRTYCQIFILRSTTSQGDLAADFDSEWQKIIVKSYGATDAPQLTEASEQDGWQFRAGVATFAFDGGTSIALLTTMSGYGRAVSIVAVTSSKDYLPAVQDLLASVEMKQPTGRAVGATTASKRASTPSKATAKPAALQGYMDYSPFTKTWTWKVRYPPQ